MTELGWIRNRGLLHRQGIRLVPYGPGIWMSKVSLAIGLNLPSSDYHDGVAEAFTTLNHIIERHIYISFHFNSTL